MAQSLNSLLIRLLRLVRSSLSPRLKKAWFLLSLLLLLGALLDFLALSTMVPFLRLVSSEQASTPKQFFQIAIALGYSPGSQAMILLFGACLAIIILTNSLLKTLTSYLSGRVTAGIGTQLARQCFANSLYQSYEKYALSSSAELLTRISRVDMLVGGVLQPLFQAMSAIMTIIFVLVAMLFIQPLPTVLIAFIVGAAFVLCHQVARRRLRYISSQLGLTGVRLTRILQESSSSFRDLKLYSLEPIVLSDFIETDYRARLLGQESSFLGAAPKLIIEGVGLAILLLVSIALSITKSSSALIVTIGFIVFGFQKLLPAAQQLFSCASSLRSYSYVISDIADNLPGTSSRLSLPFALLHSQPAPIPISPLDEAQSFAFLECSNLYYAYPGQQKGLGPVNLSLRSGEMLGVVGATGAGKSTLIDLLMGLLRPSEGQILINGQPLSWNPLTQSADQSWTRKISHVPQRLYLTHGSILDNICLSSTATQVDAARLRLAVNLSCLNEFIQSLPQGLNSSVGEGGIRLSGGQCQRIAIARAIYRGGQILVLDEATSALDPQTERVVMQGLRSLPDVTIIAIAHRLCSLELCDRIIKLEAAGRPLQEMSYQELLDSSYST